MSLYRDQIKTPCSYMDIKDCIFRRFEAPLKLWKRDFFMDNFLYFPENVWFEDVISHIKGLILAKRITFVYENLYFYRHRVGSIMKTGDNSKILDFFYVYEEVLNFLKKKGLYEDLEQEYISFIRRSATSTFNRASPKLKKVFVKNLKIFCKNHPELLDKDILNTAKRRKKYFHWTENDKWLKILFFPIFRLKFNEKKGKYILKILGIPVFKWRKHDS